MRTRLSAGGRWIRTSGSARVRTTPGSASCALPGPSNAPAARARLERDQAAPGFGEEGEHCRRTRYREDGCTAKAQERAEPEVRIHLPPADSLSLSRSRFRRSRTRLSARVWAAGLAIGSAETLGFFDIAPIGGNISVGPNSSTAVRLMWWRDCHAGPNEVGPSLTYGRSLNPDWAQAKPSTIR